MPGNLQRSCISFRKPPQARYENGVFSLGDSDIVYERLPSLHRTLVPNSVTLLTSTATRRQHSATRLSPALCALQRALYLHTQTTPLAYESRVSIYLCPASNLLTTLFTLTVQVVLEPTADIMTSNLTFPFENCQSQSTIFGLLPSELRIEIYAFAFTQNENDKELYPRDSYLSRPGPRKDSSALLRTCKLAYAEGRRIFLEQSEWTFWFGKWIPLAGYKECG